MLVEDLTDYDRNFLHQQGVKVVYSESVGDYELYLLHQGWFNIYQIGIQRSGFRFASKKQQLEKQKTSLGQFSRLDIKQVIEKWLAKVHRIYIGSENNRKEQVWFRLLNKIGIPIKMDLDFGKHYIGE